MLIHYRIHRIPSIEQLGVLPLLLGWDASPSQDTQHDVPIYIHLGGERGSGIKFLVQGNNTMAGPGL